MKRREWIVLPLLLPALAGCSGWQSALDPHGPEAKHLADLIWIFTAVCAAVWLENALPVVTAANLNAVRSSDIVGTEAAAGSVK